MKINVTANTKQVLATVRADQQQITVAQVQALNRTADQVRIAAAREIRLIYNVKAKFIKELGKINRAGKNQQYPEAVVTFSGRSIPLIEFDARERTVMSTRGKRRQVTVKVLTKGGRVSVEGAFIGTVRSGHLAGQRGIFRRIGAARKPIKFQTSIAVPMVLRQRAIATAILKVADERYAVNFTASLRNQLRLAGNV